MTVFQDVITDIAKNKHVATTFTSNYPNKADINYRLAHLEIESAIPLFKAKLLQLNQEASTILNDDKASLSLKEKKMDKTIKKSKKLFLEVIHFIFNSPIKKSEFIINKHDNGVTLNGNLGYLLHYFSNEYGIDIERNSKILLSLNKHDAILNHEMSVDEFITVFNTHYYRISNDDNLM
jgi:hypothetical protein